MKFERLGLLSNLTNRCGGRQFSRLGAGLRYSMSPPHPSTYTARRADALKTWRILIAYMSANELPISYRWKDVICVLLMATQPPTLTPGSPSVKVTGEAKELTSRDETYRRLKNLDPGMIEQVVRKYTGQLFRAALGTKLAEPQARDVVQSTIVTFLETLQKFQGRSHVRTWLFGILYKKISELRRKLRRQEKEDDIDEVVSSRYSSAGMWTRPPIDPETFLQNTQARQAIQVCMENLPEMQQRAFYLKEVEGFSTQEICNILEITATNLGVILYRARNRLRDCIECKGVRSSETDTEL